MDLQITENARHARREWLAIDLLQFNALREEIMHGDEADTLAQLNAIWYTLGFHSAQGDEGMDSEIVGLLYRLQAMVRDLHQVARLLDTEPDEDDPRGQPVIKLPTRFGELYEAPEEEDEDDDDDQDDDE